MSNSFSSRQGERTLFQGLGCRVDGLAIVGSGFICVTDQRVFFRPSGGSPLLLERDRIQSITRAKFGFLPAMVVHGTDDTELSLIVPDGWSLDRALCAMEGQGVAAGDGAPGLVNVPARSRFVRAVSILGLAFVAAGKALLGDLGLRRFR